MNSAYSYRYSAMPAEYYDYNYDVGTLSEVPGNYRKNNLMYQRQNNLLTRPSNAVAYIVVRRGQKYASERISYPPIKRNVYARGPGATGTLAGGAPLPFEELTSLHQIFVC